MTSNASTFAEVEARYKWRRWVVLCVFELVFVCTIAGQVFFSSYQQKNREQVQILLAQSRQLNAQVQERLKDESTPSPEYWAKTNQLSNQSISLSVQALALSNRLAAVGRWNPRLTAATVLLVLCWILHDVLNWWSFTRKAGRYRKGRCICCAYDLRGSTDRCPECGVAFEPLPHLKSQ